MIKVAFHLKTGTVCTVGDIIYKQWGQALIDVINENLSPGRIGLKQHGSYAGRSCSEHQRRAFRHGVLNMLIVVINYDRFIPLRTD